MESNDDHHQRQQQQQQPTQVRPHTRLQRSRSSLYDYTWLWGRDLVGRDPLSPPASSSSTNPLNPIAVHDRMVISRRRWTRWVCLGFVVSFLVNVASSVYIVVTLSAAEFHTDSFMLEEFLKQDGSEEILDNVNVWKKQNEYSDQDVNDDATPIAIHFVLGRTNRSSRAGHGVLTGWKATNRKHLRDVEYTEQTGTFRVNSPGTYLVYSQLSFRCPDNTSNNVEFGQELKDANNEILLDDFQRTDCHGMPLHLPGHVSFMMSSLRLQSGALRLLTNRRPERKKALSFFGIFKLD